MGWHMSCSRLCHQPMLRILLIVLTPPVIPDRFIHSSSILGYPWTTNLPVSSNLVTNSVRSPANPSINS